MDTDRPRRGHGPTLATPSGFCKALSAHGWHMSAGRRKRRWRQSLALVLCIVTPLPACSDRATPPNAAGGRVDPANARPVSEITAPLEKSYREVATALGAEVGGAGRTPARLAERLEAAFELLEEARREIPRDTFDVAAVIDSVGSDPIRLFDWVRTHTYLVPYRGILRGHRGVLMDRVGNSLDRAILLATLLKSAGHQARLSRGALTVQQATQLGNDARQLPNELMRSPQEPRIPSAAFLEKLAVRTRADASELRRRLEKLAEEQDRSRRSVMRLVSVQSRAISQAVGMPAEGLRAIETSATVKAFQDHWWVQWHDGTNWVDLDPSKPTAKPGEVLAVARESHDMERLPASLYHELRIRIVAEKWHDGRLTPASILSHTVRPLEVLGEPIVLSHYPLKWPRDPRLLQTGDRTQNLRAAAIAQDEWAPLLMIGSTPVIQSSVRASGEVNRRPLDRMAGGQQAAADHIGGILGGGAIGGVPARTPNSNSHFVAEWIEFEIRVPGQPSRRIRRDVFDLLPPGARDKDLDVGAPDLTERSRLQRSLALLGQMEILPLPNHLTRDFVDYRIATHILANRGASGIGVTRPGHAAPIPKQTPPIVIQPYALALARTLWRSPGEASYLDRPNVITYRRHFHLGPKQDLRLVQGFDLVFNEVAVHPARDDAFRIRMEQGILDSNLEALMAAAMCSAAAGASNCPDVESPVELLHRPYGEGPSLLTIRGLADRALQNSDPAMRVRMARDLAEGYVLVLPGTGAAESALATMGTMGWWRVRPGTGDTIAIGNRGWGQGSVDNALTAAGISWWVLGSAYCVAFVPKDDLWKQSLEHPIACGPLFGLSAVIMFLGFMYIGLFEALGI